MGNLLLSLRQLGRNFLQEPSHSFFPIKHGPDFLITGNIILHLLLQRFINAFVLENAHQALIDLSVEDFILVGEFGVLLAQGFTLYDGLV